MTKKELMIILDCVSDDCIITAVSIDQMALERIDIVGATTPTAHPDVRHYEHIDDVTGGKDYHSWVGDVPQALIFRNRS